MTTGPNPEDHDRDSIPRSPSTIIPVDGTPSSPNASIWHDYSFISRFQLGHMRPPAPADLMVFDHRETEEVPPVASPSQVAKVLGDV